MLKKCVQHIIFILLLSIVSACIVWFKVPAWHQLGVQKIIVVCLFLSSVLVLFLNRLLKYFEIIRYLRSPISRIDKMTGEEFEYYLKLRFEREGYKVEMTKASQDYGADLILKNRNESVVVQAKRYDANVGTAAVQEVVAAKEYYQADNCMVVTNSHFTINALNLAEVNDVELRDRDDLLKRTLR